MKGQPNPVSNPVPCGTTGPILCGNKCLQFVAITDLVDSEYESGHRSSSSMVLPGLRRGRDGPLSEDWPLSVL